MSFDATKWVRAQAFSDPLHRYLALEIANYADNGGKAWPSVETPAKVTLLSPRTVSYKLAQMEKLGLLRRERRWKKGHQTSNVICLATKLQQGALWDIAQPAPRAVMESMPAPRAPMPPTMPAPRAGFMPAPRADEPSKEEPFRKNEPVRQEGAPSALPFDDAHPLHMNGHAKEASATPTEPVVLTERYGRQESKKQRPDRSRPLNSSEEEGFEEFFAIYPRRVVRLAAVKAWGRALKEASAAQIIAGARRYAAERQDENPQYTKHPATWLNAGCWMDEPGANGSHHEKGYAELAVEVGLRRDEERGVPPGTSERELAGAWEQAADDQMFGGLAPGERTKHPPSNGSDGCAVDLTPDEYTRH